MADNDNKGEIRERLIFGKCDEGNECSTGEKRVWGKIYNGRLSFCVFLKINFALYFCFKLFIFLYF
jgi:hypothetical protein